MTLLNALLDQIIFGSFIAVMVYCVRIPEDHPIRDTFSNSYFLTYVMVLFFVVMTYVRWRMDWPLLGVYHYLLFGG